MGADQGDMGGAIREKQEGLRENVDVLLNAATDHLAQPTGGRLTREENGMAAGPERFGDDSAHRRLPGTINALERDEPREQARGERMRWTLTRRRALGFPLAHNVFIEYDGSVALGPGRGAETISWKLRPDLRRVSDGGDREARCRKCHTRIVLLPDDRRQGYCFDCYDSLEVRSVEAF